MKKAALILLAAVAAALMTACVSGEQIRNYNLGVEAYNAGDIVGAKTYFSAAGGYGNSKSYLAAIRAYEDIYAQAGLLFDAHEYDEAQNCYDSIKEYADSAERSALIDSYRENREKALDAYEKGDYPEAGELFAAACGYGDSDEYVRRISVWQRDYDIALQELQNGFYSDALSAFERIEVPFRDSEEQLDSLYRLFARKGVTAKLFIRLFSQSCENEEPPVTIPTADVSGSEFTFSASNGMLVTGSADDNGFVSSISFWIDRDTASAMGRDGVKRAFAHCIHALSMEAPAYAEILKDLDDYTVGSRARGIYTFTYTKNAAGVEMLTAERK